MNLVLSGGKVGENAGEKEKYCPEVQNTYTV
jgi:hypothetical protein